MGNAISIYQSKVRFDFQLFEALYKCWPLSEIQISWYIWDLDTSNLFSNIDYLKMREFTNDHDCTDQPLFFVVAEVSAGNASGFCDNLLDDQMGG